ncbi:hypothetical protein THAOC_06403, partial [Thalassiosira oceanica]
TYTIILSSIEGKRSRQLKRDIGGGTKSPRVTAWMRAGCKRASWGRRERWRFVTPQLSSGVPRMPPLPSALAQTKALEPELAGRARRTWLAVKEPKKTIPFHSLYHEGDRKGCGRTPGVTANLPHRRRTYNPHKERRTQKGFVGALEGRGGRWIGDEGFYGGGGGGSEASLSHYRPVGPEKKKDEMAKLVRRKTDGRTILRLKPGKLSRPAPQALTKDPCLRGGEGHGAPFTAGSEAPS